MPSAQDVLSLAHELAPALRPGQLERMEALIPKLDREGLSALETRLKKLKAVHPLKSHLELDELRKTESQSHKADLAAADALLDELDQV